MSTTDPNLEWKVDETMNVGKSPSRDSMESPVNDSFEIVHFEDLNISGESTTEETNDVREIAEVAEVAEVAYRAAAEPEVSKAKAEVWTPAAPTRESPTLADCGGDCHAYLRRRREMDDEIRNQEEKKRDGMWADHRGESKESDATQEMSNDLQAKKDVPIREDNSNARREEQDHPRRCDDVSPPRRRSGPFNYSPVKKPPRVERSDESGPITFGESSDLGRNGNSERQYGTYGAQSFENYRETINNFQENRHRENRYYETPAFNNRNDRRNDDGFDGRGRYNYQRQDNEFSRGFDINYDANRCVLYRDHSPQRYRSSSRPRTSDRSRPRENFESDYNTIERIGEPTDPNRGPFMRRSESDREDFRRQNRENWLQRSRRFDESRRGGRDDSWERCIEEPNRPKIVEQDPYSRKSDQGNQDRRPNSRSGRSEEQDREEAIQHDPYFPKFERKQAPQQLHRDHREEPAFGQGRRAPAPPMNNPYKETFQFNGNNYDQRPRNDVYGISQSIDQSIDQSGRRDMPTRRLEERQENADVWSLPQEKTWEEERILDVQDAFEREAFPLFFNTAIQFIEDAIYSRKPYFERVKLVIQLFRSQGIQTFANSGHNNFEQACFSGKRAASMKDKDWNGFVEMLFNDLKHYASRRNNDSTKIKRIFFYLNSAGVLPDNRDF